MTDERLIESEQWKNELLRFDVIEVDFGEKFYSETAYLRPAVIFQNDMSNATSPNVTVIPVSTAQKSKLPTHIILTKRDGFKLTCIALAENITTISKEKVVRKIGYITSRRTKNIIEIAVLIHNGFITPEDGIKKIKGIRKNNDKYYIKM